ncbi:hypothetical protein [Maridesulfovibrio sp.]|uniref:hypothetical protein n=1 Tax=Maridesulfovibrio sp. TaxID=2795000 RepID=UPI003BAB113B
MFGMLDYRARKLFVLLGFPIYLFFFVLQWFCVLIPIGVLSDYSWHPLLKVLAAVVFLQILWAFLALIGKGVDKFFSSAFFWVVDVEPSLAETKEEAAYYVQYPRFLLNKKFALTPLEWTNEDTLHYAKFYSWQVKAFVDIKSKINEAIEQRRVQFQECPDMYDYDQKYYVQDGLVLDWSGRDAFLMILFSKDCLALVFFIYAFVYWPK